MKILGTAIEPGSATQACVDFVIRVTLGGWASDCVVSGRVVGPRAPGFTTVEVAYPLTVAEVSDNAVSLRCVIPEPSLWEPDAPFGYAWSVEVRVDDERTDSRAGSLAFPGPK